MTPVAPTRGRLILAFAVVYVVWGSTYLAIRIGIETLPPFLMMGVRHALAGAILFSWMRARGAPAPALRDWGPAALVGGLLLLGGNGAVSWAQSRGVPSGLTALIIAFTPVWMVLIEWLRPGGTPPRRATLLGIAMGVAGLAILVNPAHFMGGAPVPPIGAAVLVFGTLSWATGSLVARGVRPAGPPLLGTGMQMLAGGAMLIALGLASGEAGRVHLDAVSGRSIAAFVYLVVFGSLAGFTAYTWLLAHASIAKVSTYAYVNPVVAVLLGWAIAGEPLTPRVLIAAAIIVGAVAIVTMARGAPPRAAAAPAAARRHVLGGSPGR